MTHASQKNQQPIHTLDPFTFPLHGSRLIEASAGTGKTYTIASLYLRLVLGHGNEESRHCQPLTVDQILVVTFTDAATGELKDRIRSRIHDARLAFIGEPSDDPLIQRLMRELDQHDYRIQLLLTAEQQMDEAAIFTIHGFCQRMLKQHAFESGTLFSSELISDIEPLLKTSVADFWRKKLYPLDKPLAALIRKCWKSPEDLLLNIRNWLSLYGLTVDNPKLPDSLDAFHSDCLQPWLALKQQWRDDADTINEQITNCGMISNRKPLTRLGLMNDFIASDELIPSFKDGSWALYSTETLQKNLTKKGVLPQHPIFKRIDELLETGSDLKVSLKGVILKEALFQIKEQLLRLKAQKHQLSFDDLLSNLALAFDTDTDSYLASAIRDQFRIAMIDEFQDTDPLQYSIFNHIYIDNEDADTGLFMIGDPKQAIYAFRGADIFTYMQARHQVNAHYTLGTNWRSTTAMVETVNTVFRHADSPFIYDDDIPFEPVQPSPLASRKQLMDHEQPIPAMTFWLDDNDGNTLGNTEYAERMTQATALEINRLLTAADQKQCMIQKEGSATALQPGDIAVLVRTKHQGQVIREALAQQGIPSIYLSNSDSVYSCQEAVDIQRILYACLSPTNERVLKAALATQLLNLDAASLDALNRDEEAWESAVEEFSDYHNIWLQRGVLPMLRSMMSRRGVAEQLITSTFGERRLTDALHIGECLSVASQTLESPHALVRWLGEQIKSPNEKADEQQLHLESERNLVKVVTIHKSKGLEYNVVFLPFICGSKPTNSPLFHDQDNGEAILELTYAEESLEKADKERLAEDLRLLYVALTRSVHRCYLGIAPVKPGNSKSNKTHLHLSAFGYLLNKGQEIAAPDLAEKLQALSDHSTHINILPPPTDSIPRYLPPKKEEPELKARSFSGRIEKEWWVTSYSALSKNSHGRHSQPTPDASLETAGHDMEVAEEENTTIVDEFSLFQFPKGARPGTFMHSLFEDVDMDVARTGAITDFVTERLIKEGYEEHWTPSIENMVLNCLNARLDGKNMRLMDLSDNARRVEMEFYLPISQLNASSLNRLIVRHDKLSARAGELEFMQVKGMLKGFIDLTFEYQGRWYVLDYKSNHLGNSSENYSRYNMAQVMVEHRYDLQYQLYSLALHRLLKQRVPDYDYEQHFGGVIYLFLRGVQPDDSERHGIYDHRPEQSFIEALDQLFAGEQEAATC
ncbi:exodeoxyribonuclease V subunit beta [Endozoicomonas sp. (ex Bugula neritina AB1)]|nr:exodeoxyribonuclease V subunit beta [Endozoicomonas sp. (ex Bugula neritina AB1)]